MLLCCALVWEGYSRGASYHEPTTRSEGTRALGDIFDWVGMVPTAKTTPFLRRCCPQYYGAKQ
jgi:hypothetical protein